MKLIASLVFLISLFSQSIKAQSYTGTIRTIEPCTCQVKVDSSFHTRCAFLLVPENRQKNNVKMIKLPFIFVESKNPVKKKDPLVYTSGGPGGSSLGWAEGIPRRFVIDDRDCIAFEQRGTWFAVPNLAGNELSDAIKTAYRQNLNHDSMAIEGTKRLKKSLVDKGIDLAAYNTDESVADMQDLFASLHLDSVNLFGISYSGGLMMAVLQKNPSRIRSLILDSPLPTFIPIDEDEPANLNEALNIIFERVAKDSVDKKVYGDMKRRFQHYFNSITGKIFSIRYLENGTRDSITVNYTRNELYDIIENTVFNSSTISDLAAVINDFISGNHRRYIIDYLDGIFNGSPGPSAMRIAVYCADQTAYHQEEILHQLQTEAYPWMAGYHINDVYRAICDCWQSPPVNPITKRPFYSSKPALLADGELDIACRPIYIDRIHHYLPNSQRLLFKKRSHGVGGIDMAHFMQNFLNDPYTVLKTTNPDILVY